MTRGHIVTCSHLGAAPLQTEIVVDKSDETHVTHQTLQ